MSDEETRELERAWKVDGDFLAFCRLVELAARSADWWQVEELCRTAQFTCTIGFEKEWDRLVQLNILAHDHATGRIRSHGSRLDLTLPKTTDKPRLAPGQRKLLGDMLKPTNWGDSGLEL